jgi:hypothetical protein
MNRDDIIRMAREAGLITESVGLDWCASLPNAEYPRKLVRFAARVEEHLISQGYRKCAEGQRTTQFCDMVEAAREEEREACARLLEDFERFGDTRDCVAAILKRGEK